MNQAVTIAVKTVDGRKTFAIISDPNVPHNEQRRNFRKLRRDLHGEYDEVQLWTATGGRVKRQRTCLDPVAEVAPVASSPTAESQDAAAETKVSANSGEESASSPAPVKNADGLAKARAAAAAKKAAKAKAVDPLS